MLVQDKIIKNNTEIHSNRVRIYLEELKNKGIGHIANLNFSPGKNN